MKSEFTVILESAPDGGYWATCLEVAGANGQDEIIEETRQNLIAAVELILEDNTSPESGSAFSTSPTNSNSWMSSWSTC